LSFQVEQKEKDKNDWRRNKVQDLSILRQQAKHNIKRYIDERLPEEYEKCLVGLTAITKEAWNTAQGHRR
jgi:hypothetical protein